MYFDTHAHYDDARFDADRDALLASLPENGVSHVVNPGCDAASSRAAVEIARRHPHVRAAAGIHPEQADRFSPEALREIRELLALPEVVAVGEVGLDYYWPENPSPEIQRACFRAMMELAREYRNRENYSFNNSPPLSDREPKGWSLWVICPVHILCAYKPCSRGCNASTCALPSHYAFSAESETRCFFVTLKTKQNPDVRSR